MYAVVNFAVNLEIKVKVVGFCTFVITNGFMWIVLCGLQKSTKRSMGLCKMLARPWHEAWNWIADYAAKKGASIGRLRTVHFRVSLLCIYFLFICPRLKLVKLVQTCTRWSKSVQIGLNLSKIGDGIFQNICHALICDLKLDCNLYRKKGASILVRKLHFEFLFT